MAIRFNGKALVNGRLAYGRLAHFPPAWITSSGSLGIYDVGESVSFQFQATDPTYITYAVIPGYGTLPSNLTLSSSGLLSGSLADVETTTIFNNIRINATNGYGLSSYITVSITVDAVVSLTCDTTEVTMDSSDNIASTTAAI